MPEYPAEKKGFVFNDWRAMHMTVAVNRLSLQLLSTSHFPDGVTYAAMSGKHPFVVSKSASHSDDRPSE
jgi:hypothetical protein